MKHLMQVGVLTTMLVLASCQSGAVRSDFERMWAAVGTGADAVDEARRVDELVAYVKRYALEYEIALLDLETGQLLPIEKLGPQSQSFAVRMRVKNRAVAPDWRPKNVANVQKLVLE